MTGRILHLDIECSPATAHIWGTFKVTIPIQQIIEPARILCFTAKWHGQKKMLSYSEWEHGRVPMLQALHDLLDEAEVIVTYNGKRFDIPWIKGELILEGFLPPSPFKQIDLYQVIKANSRFLSNKLGYVSDRLLGDTKLTHTGFQLWKDVLAGDKKAQKLMVKYCEQDVKLLEPLYEKLRPWVYQHPNLAIESGDHTCPKCSSANLVRRGYTYTQASKFQRYRCSDCGGWSHNSVKEGSTSSRNAQ